MTDCKKKLNLVYVVLNSEDPDYVVGVFTKEKDAIEVANTCDSYYIDSSPLFGSVNQYIKFEGYIND